jgi:hypothetical protein
VCGIRPEEKEIVIDPFPFGLKHVLIDDVIVRGKDLKVEITGNKFVVWMDGNKVDESSIGEPITLSLP